MTWGNWGGSFIYYLDGQNSLKQGACGFSGTLTSSGVTLFDPAGIPVSPSNPLPVQDAQTEALLSLIQVNTGSTSVGIGTPSDPAYTGSGNTSTVGGIKGLFAQLVSGITLIAGSVKIVDRGGTNQAVVNADGSQLTAPETTYLTAPPTRTNGVTGPVLTDAAGNVLVNSSASNGLAGTSINPPAGGMGILGYLSGIYQAITGTVQVAIQTGSAAIGTVALTAGSAVIGAVTQSGAWIFTLIPTNAAGAWSPATVTNTAASLLAANTAKKVLRIYNAGTGIVWINFGGTAAANTAGSVPITPNGAYIADPQFIPSDAISAISTVASNPVTICAA